MLKNTFSLFSVVSRPSLAIDLGNRNTLLWIDNDSQLLESTSAVAYQENSLGEKSVLAVGHDALQLEGRVQAKISVVRPLTSGMVTDVSSAAQMLKGLLNSQRKHSSSFDKILISVPASASSIERKAFAEVAMELNPRKVFLIEEPLSAAIGAGLDVLAPQGRCVVDVGDGIVESVIISMGQIVSSCSKRMAASSFEELLRNYLRVEYNFHIGRSEAEKVKIYFSSQTRAATVALNGFCSKKNLPASRLFYLDEMNFIRQQTAASVAACLLENLESAPPEISSDLFSEGVYLTGGHSLDLFLKQYLEKQLKFRVNIVNQPLRSVLEGNKTALMEKKYSELLARCA